MLAYLLVLTIIGLLENVTSLPNVYKMFEKRQKSSFLISFKAADLEAAHNPEAIFKISQREGKTMGMGMEDFIRKGKYHSQRGIYVHKKIAEHHKRTRKWIQEFVPEASIASSIPVSNSFLILATKSDIRKLETNDNVTEIHTNEAFRVDLPLQMGRSMKDQSPHIPGRFTPIFEQDSVNEEGSASVQWNIAKIGADKVWRMDKEKGQGEGIIYAIGDTGVDFTHPNVRKNYIGLLKNGTYNHNKAWYDGVRRAVAVEGAIICDFASGQPCDDRGHGTHVTSIATGSDGYGVAPGAKWMACRNMDRGVGSPETYLNCLNFFLAPHDLDGRNPDPDRRPHVVGNSYGCPDSEGCSKFAMTAAVEALRAAGVFMSVSAGNEGPGCSTIGDPPALEKSVVSVGATDIQDKLAGFSSRGPCIVNGEKYRKPDVSAPGVGILAAYMGGGWRSLSGTSMASPHVGGLVALISALCPCLLRDVDRIQALIESTAVHLKPPRDRGPLCGDDTPDSIPNNYFGYGRIDALAAIKTCQKMCQSKKYQQGLVTKRQR